MKPIPSLWNPKMLFTAFISLFWISCTSVDKRIEASAHLFSSYPPEVQADLRQGKIALGYDMKMVEIAKGEPTYVNIRQSEEGETTIWRYMQLRQYTKSVPVYDTGPPGARWANITETEEFEVLRVEFRNGQVSSFEQIQ
ncbi:hypothetical protein P0Y35_17705 [Kiritimatiellaeota bacterium B1221]|nr:hypothetical protein [Kiritimatiellaeota bacterium B1221]